MKELFTDERYGYYILEDQDDLSCFKVTTGEDGLEYFFHHFGTKYEDHFRTILRKNGFLPVVVNLATDEIIAYIRFDMLREGNRQVYQGREVVVSRPLYLLRTIEVAKRIRSRGLGKLLAGFSMPSLSADIVTRPDNDRARVFFKNKLGFVPTDTQVMGADFSDHLILYHPKVQKLMSQIVSSAPQKYLPSITRRVDEMSGSRECPGEDVGSEEERFQMMLKEAREEKAGLQRLERLGEMSFILGDWELALRYYEACLEIATERDNLRVTFDAMVAIGRIYKFLNRFQDATHIYSQLREKAAGVDDRKALAEAIMGEAWIMGMLGKDQKGLDLYDNALATIKGKGHTLTEATIFVDKATILMYMGNYDLAEVNYKRGLRIQRSAGDETEIPRTLCNLGSHHMSKNNIDEAERILKEALIASRSTSNTFVESTVKLNLSEVYCRQKKIREAKKYLGEARDFFSKVDEKMTAMGYVHVVEGIIFQNNGEFESAEESLNKAIEILKTHAIPFYLGIAYLELGRLYRKWQRRKDRKEAFTNAYSVFQTRNNEHYMDIVENLEPSVRQFFG